MAWLLLSVAVIVLDQWSKAWVLSSLPEYTAVPVIDGFWNWYRTYNTGAAFSFLAGAGGWQLWLFTGLAVAISGLLGWWLFNLPRGQWKAALPYALVIGGAIGNRLGTETVAVEAFALERHKQAIRRDLAAIRADRRNGSLFAEQLAAQHLGNIL